MQEYEIDKCKKSDQLTIEIVQKLKVDWITFIQFTYLLISLRHIRIPVQRD